MIVFFGEGVMDNTAVKYNLTGGYMMRGLVARIELWCIFEG